MLFTGTDILVHEIMFTKIFMKIRIYLISVTTQKNFFDPVYRKVVDKMNDEIKEKINGEFVQLKLKISLLITNNEDIKKAKGVNKNVVKNTRH